MRTFLLSILLLTGTGLLYSQGQFLLPVRKDHQWEFVRPNGKAPRNLVRQYDILGDKYLDWNFFSRFARLSPYRLVEKNGKIGLINNELKEVLPCRYKRIRPLSHLYFAVETDSLFTVTDTAGNNLLGDYRYEDIYAIDSLSEREAKYFLVKKSGKWGVHRNKGELVLEPQYAELYAAYGHDFFRAKKQEKDTLWGLVNKDNREVLPFEYKDIIVFNHQFIAVTKTKKRWYVVDDKNKIVLNADWRSIRPLNRKLASLDAATSPLHSRIWHLPQDTFLPQESYYQMLFTMPGGYIMAINGGKYGVLDSNAREIVPPVYDSVKWSGLPGIFYYKNKRFWGLCNAKGDTIGAKYIHVGEFADSLAFIYSEEGSGLINADWKEEVAPIYREIVIDDGVVKAYRYKTGRLNTFLMKGNGVVAPYDEHRDVVSFTLKKGAFFDMSLLYKSAYTRRTEEVNNSRRGNDNSDEPIKSITNAAGTHVWQRSPKEKWWEFLRKDKDTFVQVLPARYADLFALNRDIWAVYSAEKPVNNPFAKSVGALKGKLCRMGFFNFTKGEYVTPEYLLGIRWRDFDAGYHHAAFIDTSGQMGLIDQKGRELKHADGTPVRYAYIGEFRYFEDLKRAYARVCVGGEITVDRKGQYPSEYYIASHKDLVEGFELREPVLIQYEIDKDNSKSFCVAPKGKQTPKWGYIDSEGNVVMPPQFDFVQSFHYDRIAFVMKDRLYGAINTDTHLVFDIKYRSLNRFDDGLFKIAVPSDRTYFYNPQGRQICDSGYKQYRGYVEGLCAVKRDSLWGFIDTGGVEAIPCRYRAVVDFSEGLAAVLDSSRQWVFINKKGENVFTYGTLLFKADKEKPLRFRNGRCLFLGANKKWGYLSMRGDTVIQPTFLAVTEFSNGLAMVRVKPKITKPKAAVIDTNGFFVALPESYEYIWPYNEFGAAVACGKRGGPYGLISRKGIPLTPLRYDTIKPFTDGYAPVKTAKGWGLLCADGREVITPQYEQMDTLAEGLIAVKPFKTERWVYVDTLNRRVFNLTFSRAKRFKGGLAEVNANDIINRKGEKLPVSGQRLRHCSEGIFIMQNKNNGAFYCSDAVGNNLFNRDFMDMGKFENGIVLIKNNGLWGALNRNGVYAIPPKYRRLIPQKDGNLIALPPAFYGLADKTGKVLIPPQYDRLEKMMGKNIVRVELGEKVGYFKSDGTELWPLQY